MRRRLTFAAAATCAAIGALISASAPAQAAGPLPVDNNLLTGFIGNLGNSATPPPGANDWSCKSAAHPNPVVLVHGTWEHQADNWQAFSPYLKNRGYCVFTVNYGGNPGDVLWGYKAIADSAGELKTFVDKVTSTTGAAKVDIVGHSQGGMMPRYYIKFLGGGAKVNQLVALAPSNHGTSLSGLGDFGGALGILPAVATVQPAAIDQTAGSSFMKKLDTCPGAANADICPGDPVKYTVIETNGDQVVTPYQNAFLKGANNILIQDVCSTDMSEHLAINFDANAEQIVANSLDPAHRKPVKCTMALPYIGG
jgi:pimeloyl-ACP methyl ester carboxylesterase